LRSAVPSYTATVTKKRVGAVALRGLPEWELFEASIG
jgi:hypothetical protein